MKRVYSTILIFIMMLLVNCTMINADEIQPTMSIDNITAEPGADVKVPIAIKDNPGVCGAVISISYDDKLSLTNIVSGSAFSSLFMTKPGDMSAAPLRLLWDGLENDLSNGEIAVLSFTAPDEPGEYEITLSHEDGDIINSDLNPVDILLDNGSITVKGEGSDGGHSEHTGGTATCIHKAICSECGEEYGEIDPNNHVHTEIRNKKEATASEDGYTGDTYCSDCNALLEQGTVSPKLDIVVDENAPTIYISDSAAFIGKEVTIPIMIRRNPGITGFSYDLIYDDSVLTLKTISGGEVLRDGQITTNGNVINWYTTDNVTEDGTIIITTFEVSEDANAGRTTVAVTPHDGKRNLVDENGNYVEANYIAGTIDVSKGIQGDVTGDGDITIADVVVLNRHVLGKTSLSEDKAALADVNGDGDITIGDVVVLNRRVLGKENTSSKNGSKEELQFGAASSDVPVISAESVTVLPGDTFDIPVIISGNTGIAGFAFSVSLPDKYVLNTIVRGSSVSDGTFSTNGTDCTWYASDNMQSDGEIIILNITADVEAESGDIVVSVKDGKPNNVSDEEGNTVSIQFEPINVVIDRRTECEKKGHSGGVATCTKKAVCEICHEEYGEVDPDNHAGETEIRGRKAATVSEDGYTGDIHCVDCGALIQTGTVIEKVQETHVHEYVEQTTKNPTCVEEGLKTLTCSCGESYTETIPAAGHVMDFINETLPGCTEDGNIGYYHCSICGNDFLNADGTSQLSSDQIIVGKKGHRWDEGAVTKEATPEQSGIRTYTCLTCGATKDEAYDYVEPVSISDHTFANNTNLESFIIGASIIEIGDEAFAGCVNLKQIFFEGDMPSFGSDVFKDVPEDAVLYYPSENSTWSREGLENAGISLKVGLWNPNEGSILSKPIGTCTVSLSENSFVYDGNAKHPELTVKDGDTILTKEADYTVVYGDNINAGFGTYVIYGTGSYTGEMEGTFAIAKAQGSLQMEAEELEKSLEDQQFVLSIIDLVTDGTVKYSSSDPSVAAIDENGCVSLLSGGTTTLTARAEGKNYTTEEDHLVLTVIDERKDNAITVSNMVIKGNGMDQTVKLNVSALGGADVLCTSSDSRISFSDGTIMHINGSFAGKVTITITTTETAQYKAATSSTSIVVLPKAASIKKVKNSSKKKVSVTWNKSTGAHGYEVQYALNKSFSKKVKTVTISGENTSSKTIKKLKKRKKYYFRVRSYVLVDGVKYYSDWSGVKSVKIKK